MNMDEQAINRCTETVIGCAYRVGTRLGSGFLEKCYENAMVIELRKAGLRVEQQLAIKVLYDDIVIGEYVADIVVEGFLILELKAIQSLDPIHSAQCINYLAATRFPICLLINFGRKVEVKRIVGPSSLKSVAICAPSVAETESQ